MSCNKSLWVFLIFVWYNVEIVLIVLNKKCGFICVWSVLILVFLRSLFCSFVFLSLSCVENSMVSFLVSFFFIWFRFVGFLKYIFKVLIVLLFDVSGRIIVVCKGYLECVYLIFFWEIVFMICFVLIIFLDKLVIKFFDGMWWFIFVLICVRIFLLLVRDIVFVLVSLWIIVVIFL